MNSYPKMLYKGEATYTDSDQIKNDLFDKKLKTIIVINEESEVMRRDQGFVDLCDLMYKPKPKIIEFPKETKESEESAVAEPVKQKRKYTRKVPNVSNDPA